MSIALMSTVWRDAPYREQRLLILLALADSANDDGLCWPSIATIAAKARCRPETVSRHIHGLEVDGWVQRQEMPGHSNTYIVTTPVKHRGYPPRETHPHPPIETRGVPPPRNAPQNRNLNRQRIINATRAAPAQRVRSNEMSATGDAPRRAALTRHPTYAALSTALKQQPVGRSEFGRWARAVADMDMAGVTPADIPRAVALYRRQFGEIAITPSALIANWGLLAAPLNGVKNHDATTETSGDVTATESERDAFLRELSCIATGTRDSA